MVQSTVNQFQPTGVVGDIVIDGPQTGRGAILQSVDSSGAAAPANNVIGRAFTTRVPTDGSTPNDLYVTAGTGQTTAAQAVFAGILANRKVYPLQGTAAGGTLAETITLPNNTTVELVTKTAGILVELSLSMNDKPNIGAGVGFSTTTGALMPLDLNADVPGTALQILGATIVYNNLGTFGEATGTALAIIALEGVIPKPASGTL